VIDDQLETCIALSYLPHDGQEIRGGQRHGYTGTLGFRPEPIYRAVGWPSALMRLEEGEAQTEHARLLFPTVDEGAALGAIEGEISQDRQAIRVLAGGLNCECVGIGVPSGRMNDRRIHAGFIHLAQQIVLREAGDLAMGRIGGQTLSPDMDLGVYNQHDILLLRLFGRVVSLPKRR
jgi:hypothetical protein